MQEEEECREEVGGWVELGVRVKCVGIRKVREN